MTTYTIPTPIRFASSDELTRCAGVMLTQRGETVYAVATNGRILAIVPATVEGEHMGDCIVPGEALSRRKDGDTIEMTPAGWLNRKDKTTTPHHDELRDGIFPNIDAILPDGIAATKYHAVQLNALLLADLAKALGATQGCFLTLLMPRQDPHAPVIVLGPERRFGLFMLADLGRMQWDRIAASQLAAFHAPQSRHEAGREQ